jgi:type IV secretion system protein VirB9
VKRRVLWLMLLVSASAYAQIRPVPTGGDPRLQSVAYDDKQVVQLDVGDTKQLMVAFAPGERIETIAVGDSSAWQVTAGKRGDFLFVKNTRASGMTNMTVVTDARTYSFELVPSGSYGGETPYIVRFTYGAAEQQVASESAQPITRYRYTIAGPKALRPSRIDVDGNRVLISWPDATDLPAVFAVDQGVESLVNGEMQNGQFVVIGTPERLVFRLDRAVASAKRRVLRRTSR